MAPRSPPARRRYQVARSRNWILLLLILRRPNVGQRRCRHTGPASRAHDPWRLEFLTSANLRCSLLTRPTASRHGFRANAHQHPDEAPEAAANGSFSATQTKEVRKLVRAGMRNPVQISVKVNRSSSSPSSSQRTPWRCTTTSPLWIQTSARAAAALSPPAHRAKVHCIFRNVCQC